MSKHTPGPWTLDPEGEHAIEIEDASGEVVGAAYGSGAVAEANAMLIAAAPDLLEALRHMVDAQGVYYDHPDRRLSLAQARAAIAKAEAIR